MAEYNNSPVAKFHQSLADSENVLMDIGNTVLPGLTSALQGFDGVLKKLHATIGDGAADKAIAGAVGLGALSWLTGGRIFGWLGSAGRLGASGIGSGLGALGGVEGLGSMAAAAFPPVLAALAGGGVLAYLHKFAVERTIKDPYDTSMIMGAYARQNGPQGFLADSRGGARPGAYVYGGGACAYRECRREGDDNGLSGLKPNRGEGRDENRKEQSHRKFFKLVRRAAKLDAA